MVKRFLRWLVRVLLLGALAGGAVYATALLALRDLDRAMEEGLPEAPLSRPKAVALFLAAQVLPLRQPGGPVTTPGRFFRDCDDCPEMAEIRPGYFLFGSPLFESGRYVHVWTRHPVWRQYDVANREGPRRLTRIGHAFAIARYEVTLAEWDRAQADPNWAAITGRSARYPERPRDAEPSDAVTSVGQDDAKAYAKWMSAKTGERYRLATEAEWEYAARAGTATAYPWGNGIGVNNAACRGCSTLWTKDRVGPVGLHPPNGFGLYDMIGNGWEWVQDCFVPWHDKIQTDGSAFVFEGCKFAVFKGGTAIAEPWQARAAMRVGPHYYNHGTGSAVRLVRDLPQP